MLCFTLRHKKQLIKKVSVCPPLSEMPLDVTYGIFSGVTGQLDVLIITEVDH